MAEQYFTYMNGSELKPGVRETYTYQADVTSFDLDNWALTSKTCEIANIQALKPFEDLPRSARLRIKRNSTFAILTDDQESYPQELQVIAPGTNEPFSFCPAPEEHIEKAKDLALCLACPTCWSSQRMPGQPRKHNTRSTRKVRKQCLTLTGAKRSGSKTRSTGAKQSPKVPALSPVPEKKKEVNALVYHPSIIKTRSKVLKLNTLGVHSPLVYSSDTPQPRNQSSRAKKVIKSSTRSKTVTFKSKNSVKVLRHKVSKSLTETIIELD